MSNKRILQTEHPQGFIDLGNGNPDPDLLPLGLLEEAAEKYFLKNDPHTIQYGAEQGNGYFLTALAKFLSSMYEAPVNPGSLFTTTGASSALDLLCTLSTRPGDVIFVEEPSYFLALRIFADHNLRVISIPMDESGLVVDHFDELLKKFQPKFVYTIPTFHNPTSRTLSQPRREKLIQLSQKHNFLIIADEVYHFLAYTQKPPQPFAVYANQVEQVVSINSFSKILAPGLRLGWIHAHDSMIKRLAGCGLLDSGGGMNPFTSAIVYHLIESGDLTRNISTLKKVYLERRKALFTALEEYLPDAEYGKSHGGFFTWVRLPGKDTSSLRRRAKKYGIDFRPGELFSSQQGMKEHLRLAYCYYNPCEIEKGVLKLAECLRFT